jgi:hypothetical protein
VGGFTHVAQGSDRAGEASKISKIANSDTNVDRKHARGPPHAHPSFPADPHSESWDVQLCSPIVRFWPHKLPWVGISPVYRSPSPAGGLLAGMPNRLTRTRSSANRSQMASGRARLPFQVGPRLPRSHGPFCL